MPLTRRKTIALLSGGVIAAATATTGFAVSRSPRTAHLPWQKAGSFGDIRRDALSFALLAPNPHNRQPWIADLSRPGLVTLYADLKRMLPHTDPFARQITIGLGCFLELMRMAAAEFGFRVDLDLFPKGEDGRQLDDRPIAQARFMRDSTVARDPLFAQVHARRTLKEPYDTTRPIALKALNRIAQAAEQSGFGGSLDPDDIAGFRELSRDALRIEIETPHTYQESVDLFRIGHREVDANPDGIDFTGPLFESLHLAGMFTREIALDRSSMAYQSGIDAVYANADTAMGHIWLITPANTRRDQIAAGMDWLRVNLAATEIGLGTQPLSQALQEYPEMAAHYSQIHERLAPDGGTVQMFARIGYGPEIGPSPRWPLETRLAKT